MKRSLLYVFLLSPCHLVTLSPCQARADGGTVRLSDQKGNYRITVFTSPTPLRAGPVDISVLVQDAATGEVASGVQVAIKVVSCGSPGVALHRPATRDAAANKLYDAAIFELPRAGCYTVDVGIDGPLGDAQVRFDVEVAEPLPPWLTILPWVGWPFLAILLFSLHQLLVRRKSDQAATPMAATSATPARARLGGGRSQPGGAGLQPAWIVSARLQTRPTRQPQREEHDHGDR
jgi:hypothetical protein